MLITPQGWVNVELGGSFQKRALEFSLNYKFCSLISQFYVVFINEHMFMPFNYLK